MHSYNFKDMLINESLTIKEAMKKLDLVASKILFVVSDSSKLTGSLTDGDIRRFILSNGSLESLVIDACNKNTYRIYKSYREKDVLEKMEKLDFVFTPVVDSNGIIVDIISYSSITNKIIKKIYKKIDIPVVIMAGGKGTRMEPFTNVLPKPLIPVGDKTMLEYIIEEFRKYQIDNYYLTINYKGNLIKAYIDGIEKNYSVKYIEEKEFNGTAGSLKLIEDIPETCIVTNCDITVKADYNDVIEFHNENHSVLTILSSMQHYVIPYGVVEFGSGGIVKSIKEKPEHSMTINTGVYILSKKAWDYIPEKKFFHMTHLIEALIEDGKKVLTYPVSENDYIDIGQWDEYRSALDKLS